MPIRKIAADQNGAPGLMIVCAECATESVVPAASLLLGIASPPAPKPPTGAPAQEAPAPSRDRRNIIACPKCAKCGAQEFLCRTFDVHPHEAASGHRKAVNALAEHLKSTGKVHPEHMDSIREEKGAPPQIGPLFGDVR